MVFENFYCTKCNHLIEDIEANSISELPKTIECPKCGGICKRVIGTTIHISDSFKAVSKEVKGASWAGEKMKKYSGLRDTDSTSKRFY